MKILNSKHDEKSNTTVVTIQASPKEVRKLSKGAKGLLRKIAKSLEPFTKPTTAEWALQHYVLPPTSEVQGSYTFDRAPFQRGILEAYSDPEVRYITIMSSAQVGKTTIMLIIVGYHAHIDPQNMMIVYPTKGGGDKFSKTKLDELFTYSPVLQKVLGSNKAKDGGNSLSFKKFVGGSVSIASSQSSQDLRSMSCKVVLMDEVDKFHTFPDEGDAAQIVEERAKSFSAPKILRISTPTIKSMSKIEKAFLAGNQSYFHVPCPHCGVFQRLIWRDEHGTYRFKTPELAPKVYDHKNAYYECEHCLGHISQDQRVEIMQLGRWIATNPDVKDHASFHLSELYSLLPGSTWETLSKKWHEKAQTPEGLMAFTQTSLGEPYEFRQGDLRSSDLNNRVEPYNAEIPYGIGYLTLGCDVQGNRLEYTVLGHGKDGHIWVIEHQQLMGNPGNFNDQVWTSFAQVLQRSFHHEGGGELKINRAFIDSRYPTTQLVQRKCHQLRKQGLPAFPIIGRATGDTYAPKRSASKRGSKVTSGWALNVNHIKNIVFPRLTINKPTEACFVHFPIGRGIDQVYFEQLLNARQVQTKLGVGWEPINESKREEALDCFVYAFAAYEAGQRVLIDEYVDSLPKSGAEGDPDLDEYDEDDSVLLEEEPKQNPEPQAIPIQAAPIRPQMSNFASKLAAVHRGR